MNVVEQCDCVLNIGGTWAGMVLAETSSIRDRPYCALSQLSRAVFYICHPLSRPLPTPACRVMMPLSCYVHTYIYMHASSRDDTHICNIM